MRIRNLESKVRGWLAVALVLAMAGNGFAACKVRLVYGEKWSEAGRAVKKALQGPEFKNAAKGQYVLEVVDESEGWQKSEGNLGSLKLPAIFVISESGNCFLVLESVRTSINAKKLVAHIRKVDAIRQEAEKTGFKTADQCGEFLQMMEKHVGGTPRRVVSKGYFDNVFKKLKELDKNDETGWQRRFELGCEFNRNAHADGLEIVEKANAYREAKDFAGGEAFIQKQKSLPRKHLTLDQQQALLMSEFALYREDATKREVMIEKLRKIAAAGENTFWGTSALGWLNILKVPPLSIYWGWHQGDFKGPQLKAEVKYGVGYSFSHGGKYAVRFIRNPQSQDVPRLTKVQLFRGEKQIAELSNPTVKEDVTEFEFELKDSYAGKLTSMTVVGTAGPEGNSSGQIEIKRMILRPRKDGK